MYVPQVLTMFQYMIYDIRFDLLNDLVEVRNLIFEGKFFHLL